MNKASEEEGAHRFRVNFNFGDKAAMEGMNPKKILGLLGGFPFTLLKPDGTSFSFILGFLLDQSRSERKLPLMKKSLRRKGTRKCHLPLSSRGRPYPIFLNYFKFDDPVAKVH